MPSNRNAQLRYLIIDKCLKNRGRKWAWYDILEAVNIALNEENSNALGISKTTFYEDLKDIEWRIYKGEIERTKEGRITYLRYADPTYSISNQPLSETETFQLKSAFTILSRFNGLPQFDWMNEIIPLIESKLGLVKTEKNILSFEENIDYSGAVHIPTLFNAIINERVLKITYQDFKNPSTYKISFHPYHLKQYNSRWFVLGLNPSRLNRIQNLALDRIKDIQETSEIYEVNNTNWEDYFSNIIGVTKFEECPIELQLLILDAEQAAYIQTKPLHQTQKQIKKVEDGFATSINVIPNYELEKLLLSFGDRIKITSPKKILDKIKNRINKMHSIYNC